MRGDDAEDEDDDVVIVVDVVLPPVPLRRIRMVLGKLDQIIATYH